MITEYIIPPKKRMKYAILSNDSTDDLERAVNSYLENDWNLHLGLVIKVRNSFEWYYQVMVKHE